MLTCKVGKTIVNTFTYKEKQLREWSNKGMLKCPVCGEKMLYCHGDFKNPYFRHEKNSDCPDIYSEGVTEEHIQGIKTLYNWLQIQEGITNLQLEKWIPETRQRPDIYFEKYGQEYVIEFQCSPISTKFNERRDLYRLQGINDIWILGTDKYSISEYKSLEDIEIYNIKLPEIKVKAIEKEINSSDNQLIYLNNKGNLIKIIDKFIPIETESGDSYYKTKFGLIVDIKELQKCTFDNIIDNNNLHISDETPINKMKELLEEKTKYLNNNIKGNNYKSSIHVSFYNINLFITQETNYIFKDTLKEFNENKLNRKIELELQKYKEQIEKEKQIKKLCQKLNNQFKITNKNCQFAYTEGDSWHQYLWKIEFDSDIFTCAFFIKSKETNCTVEDSYTKPFRGKRGGLGWRRIYYNKTIDTYSYRSLNIEKVFNYISNYISNTIREKLYRR
jgi:competence protein CoiA